MGRRLCRSSHQYGHCKFEGVMGLEGVIEQIPKVWCRVLQIAKKQFLWNQCVEMAEQMF